MIERFDIQILLVLCDGCETWQHHEEMHSIEEEPGTLIVAYPSPP
jgi:hypothetical protein